MRKYGIDDCSGNKRVAKESHVSNALSNRLLKILTSYLKLENLSCLIETNVFKPNTIFFF